MFTYDGTTVDNGATVGLYTVRFFNTSGSAVYVQVDTELPSGGEYYDHVDNDLGTQALWVALAEKAYAEANGLGYVTTASRRPGLLRRPERRRPVVGVASHHREARERLQHQPHQHRQPTGTRATSSCCATGSPSSSSIVGDHCYAVVGYNAASSKPFELFNPWGTDSSGWAPGEYQQDLWPVLGERSVHLAELHQADHRHRGDQRE